MHQIASQRIISKHFRGSKPPTPLESSWPSRTQVLSPKRYVLDRTQGGIRKDNNFEADDQNNFYIRFTLKRARSITRMREQSILPVVRLTLHVYQQPSAKFISSRQGRGWDKCTERHSAVSLFLNLVLEFGRATSLTRYFIDQKLWSRNSRNVFLSLLWVKTVQKMQV